MATKCVLRQLDIFPVRLIADMFMFLVSYACWRTAAGAGDENNNGGGDGASQQPGEGSSRPGMVKTRGSTTSISGVTREKKYVENAPKRVTH